MTILSLINHRLLLLFVAIVAVSGTYLSLKKYNERLNTAFLQDKVATLVNILNQPVNKEKMFNNLELEVIKEPRFSDQYRYFVRILDEDHNIYIQSPEMEKILISTLFPALKNKSFAQKIIVTRTRHHYLLMTSKQLSYKKETFFIQIALDTTISLHFKCRFILE